MAPQMVFLGIGLMGQVRLSYVMNTCVLGFATPTYCH